MQGTYHGLGIRRLQANTETGVAGSWTKQCTNCFLKQTGKTWNLDGIVDLKSLQTSVGGCNAGIAWTI